MKKRESKSDHRSAAYSAAYSEGRETGFRTTLQILKLASEGERSLVVAGGAMLDAALEELLKGAMRPHAGGSDNLFDNDRPLGTFSSRIALAYRLGLIDAEVEHALQLVRRIRNDFAHSVATASLSEASHSNRLRELKRTCDCVTFRFAVAKLQPVLEKYPAATEQVVVFVGVLSALVAGLSRFAPGERVVCRHPASFGEK